MTRFDIVGAPHHGGHGGGHHGGGRRRRNFGGGGWYGPAYGYWDWPYCYDAYGYPIPCAPPQTTIVGRAAQALEVDANHMASVIAPLMVSGFFDSIKDAVLTYTGTKATNQFIKDHHLEPYVQMGAKAISTYYGGPAAGKASDYITPMMMSVGVDDKAKDQAAQAQLAATTQAAAAHSPEAHQAVQTAADAAQKVATAFHVAQLAKDASSGKPSAQQAMNNLGKAAKGGDTSAAAALAFANLFGKKDDTAGTVRDPNWKVDESAIEMDPSDNTVGVPSSTVDVSGQIRDSRSCAGAQGLLIGAAALTLRDRAMRAAHQMPGQIVGVILTGEGWGLQAFHSVDDADDWFGSVTDIPHDYVYAAYFDKADPLFLLNESHGTLGQKVAAKGRHAPQIERSIAIASGIPLPLLAALGAGAAGGTAIWWHQRAQRRFDELARAQAAGRQAAGSPSADPLHPNTGPR